MSKLSNIDKQIAMMPPGDAQIAALQAEREDILERAVGLKRAINEFRQKWEQLDASDSQTGEKSRITGSIERLQETLKSLTDEDF